MPDQQNSQSSLLPTREDNYEHRTEENRIMCDRSVKIVPDDDIFLCSIYNMHNHCVCDHIYCRVEYNFVGLS